MFKQELILLNRKCTHPAQQSSSDWVWWRTSRVSLIKIENYPLSIELRRQDNLYLWPFTSWMVGDFKSIYPGS